MSSINNEVVAGIDVHKAMLAVVVARPEQSEPECLARKFGAGPWQLKELIDWLLQLGVQRVAMESTAQYWKPVWYALEPYFQLILAQPQRRQGDGKWISPIPSGSSDGCSRMI